MLSMKIRSLRLPLLLEFLDEKLQIIALTESLIANDVCSDEHRSKNYQEIVSSPRSRWKKRSEDVSLHLKYRLLFRCIE